MQKWRRRKQTEDVPLAELVHLLWFCLLAMRWLTVGGLSLVTCAISVRHCWVLSPLNCWSFSEPSKVPLFSELCPFLHPTPPPPTNPTPSNKQQQGGGGGGEGTELTTLKFDLKLNSLPPKKRGGGATLIPSSLPLSGVQFLISVFRKYSPGTVAGLRHGASEGAATFGSSGAVTKSHSSQGVFEGQGHTLRGSSSVEDVMPQDEVPLTGSIRGAARRLQDLCDPQHQASIDEEPEGMEVGEVKVKAQTDGAGTGDEGYPQVDVGFGAFVCVWGGGGEGGCVCVWESMRVYVRTCICVYMFVWVCICVWEHVCVCACMCVCVHAYSCACLCVWEHVCVLCGCGCECRHGCVGVQFQICRLGLHTQWSHDRTGTVIV